MNTAKEITTIEPQAALPVHNESSAIISMIERAAINPQVDIDKMERLLQMQERIIERDAKVSFNRAFAAAKAEMPAIIKNRKGHNSSYADFAQLSNVVDPVLGKHGLSYRFRTKQDDLIHVTCVLSHTDGHSEENTLSSKADVGGAKNATQAIGSAQTYLMRYSLLSSLGIAPTDDDDGKQANMGEAVTDDQILKLRDLIEAVEADEKKFCAYLKIEALADLPAKRFADAVKALEERRAK